jgi:MYXO-CTERM domain-containing protein
VCLDGTCQERMPTPLVASTNAQSGCECRAASPHGSRRDLPLFLLAALSVWIASKRYQRKRGLA